MMTRKISRSLKSGASARLKFKAVKSTRSVKNEKRKNKILFRDRQGERQRQRDRVRGERVRYQR